MRPSKRCGDVEQARTHGYPPSRDTCRRCLPIVRGCGRRLQGSGGPHTKEDPRRARRARGPDVVRAVLTPRHEISAGLVAAGDLAAPRRARGGRPGRDAARGALQVPLPADAAARASHGPVARRLESGGPMRINLASVLVDDQAKALRFYTEVLGFQKKEDVPLGEHRWLTVVSPAEPDGPELVLEPDAHPAA